MHIRAEYEIYTYAGRRKKETKKKGEGFIKAIRELIQLCTISKGIKQKKKRERRQQSEHERRRATGSLSLSLYSPN
jgi:hypothetical protein